MFPTRITCGLLSTNFTKKMTVINYLICVKDSTGLNILHAQVAINLSKRFRAFQLHI